MVFKVEAYCGRETVPMLTHPAGHCWTVDDVRVAGRVTLGVEGFVGDALVCCLVERDVAAVLVDVVGEAVGGIAVVTVQIRYFFNMSYGTEYVTLSGANKHISMQVIA